MPKQLSPDEKKYINLTARYNVLRLLKENTGSLLRKISVQRKLIDPQFTNHVDRIQKKA